jgi:hypothetical protein
MSGFTHHQDLTKIAQQYFHTLQNKFKAQTTNEGQECSDIKNLKTKLCARKKKVSFQLQFRDMTYYYTEM